MTNKEGIYCEQRTGMRGFDVSFAELGAEAFKESNLLVGEFDVLPLNVFFEAKKTLMFGEEVMTFPDSTNASGGDVDFAQSEFLSDAEAAMSGELKRVLKDGFFDWLGDSVRVRIFRSRETIKEAFGPVSLEVTPDFIELLSRVTHEGASFGNVVEVFCEFEETEFATSDFVFSGHVWFLVGVLLVKTTYQNHVAAVSLKTGPLSGEY